MIDISCAAIPLMAAVAGEVPMNNQYPHWLYSPNSGSKVWDRIPSGLPSPVRSASIPPGAVVRTRWTTDHIWLRRSFALDRLPSGKDVRLLIHHDEDAQVYLNGVRILRRTGYTTGYELIPLADSTVLRKGRNTLAVHCRQTTGGQYIDVGIVEIEPSSKR